MGATFLWHDYETFGVDPRVDRPAQFASLRTDENLEVVGPPTVLWCRLSPDYLPHPEACRITGIGPSKVRGGLCERDFMEGVLREMAQPLTCTVGYNNLRFDDEVTRHGLYRNLMDPYAREWQNGNSRFDLLDVLRLARAFRPEGLRWPVNAEGTPSFRLEDLTAANGIPHAGAHDALADVEATLAVARLLKAAQPRLWDFALKTRNKNWVLHEVDVRHPAVLIHVSGRYKALQGAFSLVVPVGSNPTRSNEIYVWDLREPFEPFLDRDVAGLRQDLFAQQVEGAEPVRRLPVKTLHANRCPIVSRDLRLLTPEISARYGLDPDLARRRADALLAQGPFLARVREAMAQPPGPGHRDPDFGLYGGGFFSDGDRLLMAKIGRTPPPQLAGLRPVFQDPRLDELYFRYRARNWPEHLAPEEAARWRAHCEARRRDPGHEKLLGLDAFREALAASRAQHPALADLWDDLEVWAASS